MKSATSSLASSLNLEVEKPEQSSTIGMVVDENPSGGPGLSVVQIDPDSLATKSGLVLGDVVLSVNGDALTSPEQAGVLLSEGVGALMLEVVREKASAKGQVGTAEEKTGGGAAEAAEAAAAEEKARKPSLGIKNEESGPDVYEVPVPPGLKPGRKFQMMTETGEKILVEVPPGFEPGQVMQVKVPKPVGAPMQQSVPAAQPAGVQVQIPPGVGPGQQFTAQMPDGQQMAVTVPDGCQAGQVIQVQAPMAMAVAPPPSGIPTAGVNTVNNTVTNVTNVTNITTVKGEGDWFAEGEVTPWCAWCCGYSACIPSCAVTDTCAFLYAAATLARRTSRPSPRLRSRPALYPLQVLQLLHGLLPARQRGVRLVLTQGLADVHRHHVLQERGQLLLLRQRLRLPLPEGHPVPPHDLLVHALRQRRLRLLQEGRLRQGAHGQDGRAADGARHGALNKQTTTWLADDLAPSTRRNPSPLPSPSSRLLYNPVSYARGDVPQNSLLRSSKLSGG